MNVSVNWHCNEQWNAVCVLLNTVGVSCCVVVQYWISCCSPVHFFRCSADFVFPQDTHTHTHRQTHSHLHSCVSSESRQFPSQLNSTSNELWKAIETELCFKSIQLGLISAFSDAWAKLHFTAFHSDIKKKNNLCSRRPLTIALQKSKEEQNKRRRTQCSYPELITACFWQACFGLLLLLCLNYWLSCACKDHHRYSLMYYLLHVKAAMVTLNILLFQPIAKQSSKCQKPQQPQNALTV